MKPKAEDKNDTGLLEYLEDIIGMPVFVPDQAGCIGRLDLAALSSTVLLIIPVALRNMH